MIASLCAALVDELLPYREQFVDNASTFFGSVERYLGLALSALDRHEEAHASFERAAAAHARLNAPILLARTRLEWGEAIVRAGDPVRRHVHWRPRSCSSARRRRTP